MHTLHIILYYIISYYIILTTNSKAPLPAAAGPGVRGGRTKSE